MNSSITTVQLGDITERVIDYRGKTPIKLGSRWAESGYRAISAKNISSGSLKNLESIRYVDEALYRKWMKDEVQKKDILITSEAPFGEAMLWDSHEKIVLSQRVFGLRLKQEIADPEYIYFYFQTPEYKNELEARATGSTVRGLRQPELLKTKIALPKLAAQKSIAKILGDLDRKIELNRRMSETLEQLGQTLFKYYFIDNPECESWEDSSLWEFVELVNGASYKSTELSESECALVTLKSFKRGGGFKRDGFKEFTGKIKDSQVVKDGDLVVAHTDMTQQAEVAGVPALVSGSGVYAKVGISMDIVKVIPKTEILNEGFLYFLMMTREFQAHKMGYIAGTTVLHLNKKCIPEFMFKVPDLKTLSIPSNLLQGIIYKKTSFDNEIVTLEKIRDSVLPKLIAGQIKL